MNFLVDENIHRAVIDYLRTKGHDVVSASEIYGQYQDEELVEIAAREHRIIVTSDNDFGTLVFYYHRHPPGVVLFRLADASAEEYLRVLELLYTENSHRLAGYFIVVKGNSFRFRKI